MTDSRAGVRNKQDDPGVSYSIRNQGSAKEQNKMKE